jgi:hypothetical protein
MKTIDEIIKEKNLSQINAIKEFDKNGNRIYFKDSRGVELWTEYDNVGNLIHFKNSSA